jgi:hypothetical protein
MSKWKKLKSRFAYYKHKKIENILNGEGTALDLEALYGEPYSSVSSGVWGNQNFSYGSIESQVLADAVRSEGYRFDDPEKDMRQKGLSLERVLNECEPLEDLVKAAKEKHGSK